MCILQPPQILIQRVVQIAVQADALDTTHSSSARKAKFYWLTIAISQYSECGLNIRGEEHVLECAGSPSILVGLHVFKGICFHKRTHLYV